MVLHVECSKLYQVGLHVRYSSMWGCSTGWYCTYDAVPGLTARRVQYHTHGFARRMQYRVGLHGRWYRTYGAVLGGIARKVQYRVALHVESRHGIALRVQ